MDNTKFEDIAPLCDDDLKQTMHDLLVDPDFEHAIKYIMPEINWGEFSEAMLNFNTRDDFQSKMVSQTMWSLAAKVTDGLEGVGWENLKEGKAYTQISNHRDIVLDAGFLNILRLKYNYPTTEIAIGDNLLIHPWIDKLVRLNKSFIVRRGVSIRQMLEVSKHLSEYIHYAITSKNESIWIAQREGRAKDGDDRTQDSVLKMLALYPEKTGFVESLKELNIIPVSISYEYDPCDFLKAKEFQQKRDNPEYKKTQQDDLLNMETGILGHKGRVIFRIGECINNQLDKIGAAESDKRIQVDMVAKYIDSQIHCNYEIFPCNYIAYDLATGENRFSDKYSPEECADFESYISIQIAKIELENKDESFLRSKMLEMYSNTLKNYLIATAK